MTKIDLVIDYIMQEIGQQKTKKGQKLPGCREVSKHLSVNKITVNKAYKKLEDMHIVYSIPRGGFYLIGIEEEAGSKLEVIDFHHVMPDPTLIPYKAFTHAMNQAIDAYRKTLFQYEEPFGLSSLRDTLKSRFEQDGIYTNRSQIMITNGAQQAIYLVLKSLFTAPSTDCLLVEEPTYSLALNMARNLNINCVGIKRNVDGIDIVKLETLFQTNSIKAFYIIPRFHNPTGLSLQEKDKKKIVKLCYQYQVLLIEDDYLADLCTDKRSLPLHYYDTNQQTFYIRSFSKTFMPGIRIGAVVIPSLFLTTLLEQKHLLDICTSSIPQGALDIYIKSGMYDTHLKKVNTCYKRKLLKAKAIFTNLALPGLNFNVPKQGLFIWLTFPSDISIDRISKKLSQYYIEVESSSQYYIYKTEKSLRLCISSVPEDHLVTALTTLLDVIQFELQAIEVSSIE